MSGAQMPWESRMACKSRSSESVTAWPMISQWTISLEWLMAMAGKYWKVELTI